MTDDHDMDWASIAEPNDDAQDTPQSAMQGDPTAHLTVGERLSLFS